MLQHPLSSFLLNNLYHLTRQSYELSSDSLGMAKWKNVVDHEANRLSIVWGPLSGLR